MGTSKTQHVSKQVRVHYLVDREREEELRWLSYSYLILEDTNLCDHYLFRPIGFYLIDLVVILGVILYRNLDNVYPFVIFSLFKRL